MSCMSSCHTIVRTKHHILHSSGQRNQRKKEEDWIDVWIRHEAMGEKSKAMFRPNQALQSLGLSHKIALYFFLYQRSISLIHLTRSVFFSLKNKQTQTKESFVVSQFCSIDFKPDTDVEAKINRARTQLWENHSLIYELFLNSAQRQWWLWSSLTSMTVRLVTSAWCRAAFLWKLILFKLLHHVAQNNGTTCVFAAVPDLVWIVLKYRYDATETDRDWQNKRKHGEGSNKQKF